MFRKTTATGIVITAVLFAAVIVISPDDYREGRPKRTSSPGPVTLEEDIQFSRDVLPILSNKCFRCHGPDENTREAGMRLDVAEIAFDFEAFVAGDIDSSEAITRIISDDASEQMPPPDSGIAPLTDGELKILKDWIRQGAKWQTHWSFIPPERPDAPKPTRPDWATNPIDAFVLARLFQHDLAPSGPAEKATLLRRVSLLVTGLPPEPELARRFLDDTSPDAWEKLVDALLASEAFGERMASVWMDLARYSDTDGFQQDEPRTNWPWRDWVINAYNQNMPFTISLRKINRCSRTARKMYFHKMAKSC